ncbi:MAG: hypothetical protein GY867_06780 [bacterium]|nr:hypothetical protein [bacterium]
MQFIVFNGDALKVKADVLALKHAQGLYGLDAYVTERMMRAGHEFDHLTPQPGGFRIHPSVASIASSHILIVGVEPLYGFGYRQIRAFAHKLLSSLAGELPKTRSVVVTLHGPGYGLDEQEAFESQIAGFLDAIESKDAPEHLETITFAERNVGRADRLREMLDRILPDGTTHPWGMSRTKQAEMFRRIRAERKVAAKKPRVFVAMPFAPEMEDFYDYGIQGAVRGAGFLCERADLSSFTGDVMDWVRDRIKTAAYVVADLTGGSPNVYLEVGYAWGSNVPTILLVRDTKDLKFDVKGQRCLVYKRIKDLEKKLGEELKALEG